MRLTDYTEDQLRNAIRVSIDAQGGRGVGDAVLTHCQLPQALDQGIICCFIAQTLERLASLESFPNLVLAQAWLDLQNPGYFVFSA